MKIVYIGIDLFYPTLVALTENGCEIEKIFTCKTDNITEFNTQVIGYAKENNIPYTIERIKTEDINELIENGVEAIICAGYYYLIPVVKDIPMINIHPTLLPVGRGLWPMPIIIMEGHKKSGVTFHKIEKEFDTGDIILQREFAVDIDENHVTYMNKVNALVKEMLEELISNFNNLYESAVPQGRGEYIKAPDESSYTISNDMSVKEADLILRAFYGYECYYKTKNVNICVINGRAVEFKKEGYKYLDLKDGYIEYN